MKRLVLELEDELHQQIKVKCTEQGTSMRKVGTDFFKGWVNNPEVSNGKHNSKLGKRSSKIKIGH